MGKDNLLIGTARGKLGDVVFYRTGGEQRFRTRVRPMNPRTDAQLVQRAIVSTAVKAYSNLITVCDHAFQNYEGKLKNHQRYMRLNIMKLRPIGLNNVMMWSPIRWRSQNQGNWVEKDATYTVVNPYIVSEGDLPSVPLQWMSFESAGINGTMIPLISVSNVNDLTYRQLAEALGLNVGDQLTFVFQTTTSNTSAIVDRTYISRMILMPASGNADEKVFGGSTAGNTLRPLNDPNTENYGDLYFRVVQVNPSEGSPSFFIVPVPTTSGNIGYDVKAGTIITSRYENNRWRRSSSSFIVKPEVKNVMSMENAVASYMKSDTSSLYLNQSTTEAQTDAEDIRMEMISEEVDMYGNPIIESEEKSTKRKK